MSVQPPMVLYDEVLDLLEETTRRIRALPRPTAADAHGIADIPKMSLLISRLLAMMGWAMARRAVANGEFSHERACREFRLAEFHSIGKEIVEPWKDASSPEIADMNDRVSMLYRRIARLDAGAIQFAEGRGQVVAPTFETRGSDG